MDRIAVYVGLDYHQKAVQVCVMDVQGSVLVNRPCENDAQVIIAFSGRYGCVVGVAIESCSGAANLAEELIQRAGWSVDLAHPGFVARMKQNPDKHDWGDARLLADLERVGYLPRVWLAPEEVRELRRLVRYRQQVANERRNIKLRISGLLRDQRLVKPPANPWTGRWLHWLLHEADHSEQGRWIIERYLAKMEYVLRELQVVEARLHRMMCDDSVVTRLRQWKGLGPVTAWTLRAEVGRFDRFRSGKQLARFCGVSPRNASSGERQADAGLIKAGNSQLRAVLMESAHRLMRFDLPWREFAAQMEERGKARCLVVAAVANRWVRWLYHQMQPDRLAA
jgi:transposase